MREEIKSEPKGLRTKIKRADDEDIKFGLLDILFPPLLPIKGVIFISQKLRRTAKEELTDKASIQEDLLELQMRYEIGEIDDQEYEQREAQLVDRLEAIRKLEEEET